MFAVLPVSAVVLLYLGNIAPAAGAVWRHYGATSNGPLQTNDKHVKMVLGHGVNAKATSDSPGDVTIHDQVGVMSIITSHVVDLNGTNVSGEGRLTGGGNKTIEKNVTALLSNKTTVVHYDLNVEGDVVVQGVDNVIESRFSSSFNPGDNSLITPTDGTTLGRGVKTVNLVISPGVSIRPAVRSEGDAALHKLAIYSQEDALQARFGGKVNAKHNNLETSFARTGGANLANGASDTIVHNFPYGQEKAVRVQIGGNVNVKSSDAGARPGNEKAVKLVISGGENTPKRGSGYTVGHKDSLYRQEDEIQAPLGGNNLATSFHTGPEKSVNRVVSGGTSISNSSSSNGDTTLPKLSPYGQEKAVWIKIGENVNVKRNSAMSIDFADTRGTEKTVNVIISANVPKGVGGTKDKIFNYGQGGNLQVNSLTTRPFGTGPRDTERPVNVLMSNIPYNQALDKATKPHSGHFHGDDQITSENFDRLTGERDVKLLHHVGIFRSHGKSFSDADHNENSPLHTAAWYGHENAIKTLLESGANINGKNKKSETPLDIASSRDHAGIVKILLSSGANPNEVNARGDTPLHIAAWHGQVNAINALLDGGSDITARNHDSQTPLDTATSRDHAKVVSLLLSRGANPNDRNDLGDTPLHTAAWYGQENSTKALLDGGADINAKNVQGKTALQIATARGNNNVGSLLFNRGQNDPAIDVRSNYNE